ncbi:MAG: ABC transporter permease [bacterium]
MRSFTRLLRHRKRELPPSIALVVLLLLVATVAPTFFAAGNLRDLVLNNVPVVLVALGMTLVIIAGEIDISVGSQFAVCSVVAGLLAKAGLPIALVPIAATACGAAMGAFNGVLIGRVGLPSIIVTLAMLVAWRDALRWTTQGAWVQELPANFQWFGLAPAVAQWVLALVALMTALVLAWGLKHLRIGRSVYAVGSDAEAARLAAIEPPVVIVGVFSTMGALVGLAAALNAVRFTTVPSNAGTGLELQAIAAVVVGGTVITGGRGTIAGTLIGVALLGVIGTAMSYVGISPFWGKAIQGLIILAALLCDTLIARWEHHGPTFAGASVARR